MINRYLAGDCIPSRLVWENVKPHLVQTEKRYVIIIFALKVLDKCHARNLELTRRQYSDNAHGVINGVGVVTCASGETHLNFLSDKKKIRLSL